jgi:uncharacterized protein
MIFEWDESKRIENWERRKVDFMEAVAIFNDPALIESIDSRQDYGEARIQALGQADGFYTWRGDARHVITAWKVGENGKKRYQALFARRNQRHES